MTTFITNSNQEIEIRLASLDDLEPIKSLNQKWTVTSLNIENKENGFLYCETYKTDDLKKIILAQEVAVACFDHKIIAYYINDNYSHLLNQYAEAITELKRKNVIPQNARVSIRTQIVVERDFQRYGIPKAMLEFLKPYLIPKFDFLFSIGINDNPKRIAHEKAGWKIIDENEFNYYCAYDLAEKNLLTK